MTFNRRTFMKISAVAGIHSLLHQHAFSANDSKPNIIYIMADDLGYGDVGCYGQTLIQTPNIDRLAREGMRFTQAYSGSTVCAPSRCVLMTGLHTGHCHIRGNHALPHEGNLPLPKGTETIPSLLKQAGYTSGMFGKWGLGYPGSEGDPMNQGFDYFYGYNCQRQAHSYYPDHLWRNREKVPLPGNLNGKQEQYSHDLITEEALQFIDRNKNNPFFLYVPYTIPHTKFQIPDLGPYADKPWKKNHKIQAAMITRMDRDIGRIIDLLKQHNLDENTLIIFTSDNGPHGVDGSLKQFTAAGPLRGQKRDLYEGGIRIPMIARWPGRIKPGSISRHITCFQDILPTFIELANAPSPQSTDGISILPTLLEKGNQKTHPYLYWEFYEQKGKRAVRWGDWKGIQLDIHKHPENPIELYNLKSDLSESNNVAAQHSEIVQKIREIFNEAHTPSTLFQFDFAKK
jgi:arylsulfatase A